jgi:outer membrane protein OmpA-like peptidoglycan-associated protein
MRRSPTSSTGALAMLLRCIVLAVALTAVAAFTARADEVKVYRQGEQVDPSDVARILDSSQPVKMRSIRLLDDTAKAAAKADKPSALSLPVQFGFDSAEILPTARPQLDALVEGIRRLPGTQAVVIEGHTDSIGPEAYNDKLSQRRAQAVRSYLVAQGIDASRLRAEGYGEQRPLPGREGKAAVNRRVQFRGR